MELTTTTGAAAALVLRMGPADPGLRRLTAVASSAGFGGPLPPGEVDGELLLCLADLLHARAERDAGLAAEVRALVASRPEAVDALRELAERFASRGQWGAAGWCDRRRGELAGGTGAAPAPGADDGGWEPSWLADWLAAETAAGPAEHDVPPAVAAAG